MAKNSEPGILTLKVPACF